MSDKITPYHSWMNNIFITEKFSKMTLQELAQYVLINYYDFKEKEEREKNDKS
jgi:hypothetical protein